MRRRRRHRPISSINMVPYLDVLLVLLVIFMITTPLFNQGVLDLPQVGERALPGAEAAALEILYEQKAAHPYRLKDHKDGGSESGQLSQEELLAELAKKSILYQEPYVLISASGTLTYQQVVSLLGALRDAGYDNIALSVENPGQ